MRTRGHQHWLTENTQARFDQLLDQWLRTSWFQGNQLIIEAEEEEDGPPRRRRRVQQDQQADEPMPSTSRAAVASNRRGQQQEEPRPSTSRATSNSARSIDWNRAAFNYNPQLNYVSAKELDIGLLGDTKYKYCNTKKYKGESKGFCCCGGKVKLPPIGSPPEPLQSLMDWSTQEGKHFLSNIRKFNTIFQMTSFVAQKIVEMPGHMPTLTVKGQVYHKVGSLLPEEGVDSSFLQIYFLGGEQQIARRCNIINDLRASVCGRLAKYAPHPQPLGQIIKKDDWGLMKLLTTMSLSELTKFPEVSTLDASMLPVLARWPS